MECVPKEKFGLDYMYTGLFNLWRQVRVSIRVALAKSGVSVGGDGEGRVPSLAEVDYMSGEALERFVEEQWRVWCVKSRSSMAWLMDKLTGELSD